MEKNGRNDFVDGSQHGFDGEPYQLYTEDGKMDFRAFRGLLRRFQKEIEDKHARNIAYQILSEEHNNSLRNGEFENAIVCLMLMRIINIYEGSKLTSMQLTLNAARIIVNYMVDLEDN